MFVLEKWIEGVTDAERAELTSIIDKPDQIKERFGTELEFGTAGLRGILRLGTAGMNAYTVKRATKGLADYLEASAKDPKVVIAYDTRRCSREFAAAAAGVLGAKGIKVYLFEDVRPVPICSFAVRYIGANAGIMITASHNPKEYNGYKVYGADGAQMSPEDTAAVVSYIKQNDYFGIPCTEVPADFKEGDKYGTIEVIGSAVD